MRTVAALYVDPRWHYSKLAGVETWGEARDGRQYRGPHPVVVHPPCAPWSKLVHYANPEKITGEQPLAMIAAWQVRLYGGVLEHPAESRLWEFDRILRSHYGRFGNHVDEYGGRCIAIEQVEWGHVARKRTWLYLVRVPREALRAPPYPGREPTHWVSGHRRRGASSDGQLVPPGIKVCSATQRNRTPAELAAYLVELARASTSLDPRAARAEPSAEWQSSRARRSTSAAGSSPP